MCLNAEQAEMGQAMGIECSKDSHDIAAAAEPALAVEDPFDPSCALAFLQDQTKENCVNTVDAEGNPCEYCTLQGALVLCLNADQAEAGEGLGIECDADADAAEQVDLPPDFFDCLQHFEEGDCRGSSCTWCNTEVGMGFCLAPAAADATKECSFFDCEFGDNTTPEEEKDIYDPAVLDGRYAGER